MKELIYRILFYLMIILILWVPILIIEETYILDYISPLGTFLCSIIMFVISLYIYIVVYTKKTKDKSLNCYKYNIFNTIILGIINITLAYYFFYLIDIGVFHQCKVSGWECFMFGAEYIIFGFEYALLPVVILIIWLIIKLIKKIKLKNK